MNSCEERGEFSIDRQRLRRSKDHTQLYLIGRADDENFPLRIDLVNDAAPHYGDLEMNDVLGKVDSVRNILSNKLSAVFRYEAKDIVDIWIIAKNERFNWQDVVNEAKAKEAGVDPIALYEIIMSIPADALDAIKWVSEVDIRGFKSDVSCIADDILKGNDNTLV